jgi:selenide,water dikinase
MQGTATGASERNWKGYGREVRLPHDFAEWKRKLITDPQTSGGLLVACSPELEGEVIGEFRREGFSQAARIGVMRSGEADLSFV